MDEGRYRRDGLYWVSPYNFLESPSGARQTSRKVLVHDATLRDGEQTPGVVFRKEDKVAIARALDEAGVDRIEAGMPAVSREDYEAVGEICALGLRADILAFVRAIPEDIDRAAECGVDGVVIEVPIGWPKLVHQFKWTRDDVLRRSVPVIDRARSKGLRAVFFPYDSTRAREEDLDALLSGIMAESPPDSIGIVDTMGCATPEAVAWLTRKYREATELPVEIHTHNDFGLALATTLAAVGAGAEVAHVCVNGLGERTGNAPLEELVLALDLLYGERECRDYRAIVRLSELVGQLSGIPIPRNKPVIGDGNFTRESGIGANFVVENPLVMFAVHPEMLGRRGNIVLGKKSGTPSINFKLKELGIDDPGEEAVARLLEAVKDLGILRKGLVSDREFMEIVRTVLGGDQ
ncbi:MAG TPA: homocitrate synthase [Magnetospirillaceae bacterium]|nr:homocitrate synthase [Magnetospirillaceae bacterium]